MAFLSVVLLFSYSIFELLLSCRHDSQESYECLASDLHIQFVLSVTVSVWLIVASKNSRINRLENYQVHGRQQTCMTRLILGLLLLTIPVYGDKMSKIMIIKTLRDPVV